MIVETLLTKWLLDGSDAKKESKSVTEHIESISHAVESLRNIEAFKLMSEYAHKLIESLESVGDQAEHLQNMAFAAGVSAEELQKLRYSSEQAGISGDETTNSISRLSRALEQAKQGSKEAITNFTELGISQERLQGFKSGADALYAVADSMSRIDNPTKRVQLSMALLGRNSAGAVKWLSQGAKGIKAVGEEGKKLGAIVSEQDLETLATTADEVSSIWAIVKGFTATLLSGFAPGIKRVVGALKEWWLANRAIVQSRVKEWIGDFLFGLGYLTGAVEDIIDLFSAWASAYRYVYLFAMELARSLRDTLGGAIQAVVGFISDFIAKHPDAVNAIKAWIEVAGAAFAAYQAYALISQLAVKGILEGVGLLVKMSVVWEKITAAFTLANLEMAALVITAASLAAAIKMVWDVLHGKQYKDTLFGQMFGAKLGDLFGPDKADTTFEVGPDGKPRVKNNPLQMLQTANNFKGLTQMATNTDTRNGIAPVLSSMAGEPASTQNIDNTITANMTMNFSGDVDRDTVTASVKSALEQVQKSQLRAAQSAVQSPIKH